MLKCLQEERREMKKLCILIFLSLIFFGCASTKNEDFGNEKLSEDAVAQGDLFKVYTFLPGGGTYYKFAFENGKLLKYVMDMPEGNQESPEYYLEQEYDFKDISKMKLEKIKCIK